MSFLYEIHNFCVLFYSGPHVWDLAVFEWHEYIVEVTDDTLGNACAECTVQALSQLKLAGSLLLLKSYFLALCGARF